MDFYCKTYLEKACSNFELYTEIAKLEKFKEWELTTIFYSALCLAKAYLYNKGVCKNSINSHESIKHWLCNESEAKRNNVFKFYEKLYYDSRDARYSHKKISALRIQEALVNYEEVKKRLKI